jgi:uncharacterized protein (TIGR00255 family)
MTYSMTGFATLKGHQGPWNWTWDVRSVNARGLDLRLRLPDWIDGLEAAVRKAVSGAVSRGNVSLSLRLVREAGEGAIALDSGALERVLATLAEIGAAAEARGLALRPASAAEIAQMRGVLETAAPEEDSAPLLAALVAQLPELLRAFNRMRAREGTELRAVLEGQLASIEALVGEAVTAAEARREVQGQTLREALERVMDNTDGADPDRVAQELALISVKSDVTEEIDRLGAHVVQARELIEGAEPRGRRLDFLVQEFNREANTLCSKSQYQPLTRIGLDLKHVIDQMREQIQNVE